MNIVPAATARRHKNVLFLRPGTEKPSFNKTVCCVCSFATVERSCEPNINTAFRLTCPTCCLDTQPGVLEKATFLEGADQVGHSLFLLQTEMNEKVSEFAECTAKSL